MLFASREDGGQKLGRMLLEKQVAVDIILGLPRGGVIVAAEVARVLRLPLDVLIVRKIGHPLQREFAVGALAEGDVVVLDRALLGHSTAVQDEFEGVLREEKERLKAYVSRFHRPDGSELQDKAVLLVDDGLATGSTTEAAVLSARKQGARRVVVAAPVASTHAVARLGQVADQVLALCVDADFDAVGRYYEEFSQTTDEEVLALLKAA